MWRGRSMYFLEQDFVIAERGRGFAARRRERVFELREIAHDAHAAASAPCRRLDQ